MKVFITLCGAFIVAVAINPSSNLQPGDYEAVSAFQASV